jgi:hypothetical protein
VSLSGGGSWSAWVTLGSRRNRANCGVGQDGGAGNWLASVWAVGDLRGTARDSNDLCGSSSGGGQRDGGGTLCRSAANCGAVAIDGRDGAD